MAAPLLFGKGKGKGSYAQQVLTYGQMELNFLSATGREAS